MHKKIQTKQMKKTRDDYKFKKKQHKYEMETKNIKKNTHSNKSIRNKKNVKTEIKKSHFTIK